MVALTETLVPEAKTRPVRQGTGTILRTIAAAVDRFLDWQDRMRARHELAAMGEGFMKDCAVSAADIERETGKPFWQV